MQDRLNCCAEADEVPMSRHSNPIPTCERREEPDCNCARELREIRDALECQNRLLVDLLAAVNGLTAAWLCRRT